MNVHSFMKGYLMKFGKDFWFWARLIIEILKAILGFQPKDSNPKLSVGHRAFNAVLAFLVGENEEDAHKAADVTALEKS